MATRLFKVGFATTDTPADIQYMTSSVSNGQYDSFQQGGAALQVTSGKTLYIGSIVSTPSNTAGLNAIEFYSSTASVADSATPPAGNTSLGKAGAASIQALAQNYAVQVNTLITVAQTRYFNQKAACTSLMYTSAVGLMY